MNNKYINWIVVSLLTLANVALAVGVIGMWVEPGEEGFITMIIISSIETILFFIFLTIKYSGKHIKNIIITALPHYLLLIGVYTYIMVLGEMHLPPPVIVVTTVLIIAVYGLYSATFQKSFIKEVPGKLQVMKRALVCFIFIVFFVTSAIALELKREELFIEHYIIYYASEGETKKVINSLNENNNLITTKTRSGDNLIHLLCRDFDVSKPEHTMGLIDILDKYDGKDIVNDQNNEGQTALHISAGEGWEIYTFILLKYGAEPTLLDVNGNTPLHYASQGNPTYWSSYYSKRDYVKCLGWLLLYKGDVSIKNKLGKTPIDLANSSSKELLNVSEQDRQLIIQTMEYLSLQRAALFGEDTNVEKILELNDILKEKELLKKFPMLVIKNR